LTCRLVVMSILLLVEAGAAAVNPLSASFLINKS